jgi:hypothetical protein
VAAGLGKRVEWFSVDQAKDTVVEDARVSRRDLMSFTCTCFFFMSGANRVLGKINVSSACRSRPPLAKI